MVTTTSHRLSLPWVRPPLSANMRLHWAERHRLTADIRHTVAWLARSARLPPSGHVTVTLVWAPPDRRRRDADNPFPTYKVCCDAIVDAGIVPDDAPEFMTKVMPVIVAGTERGMWLDVELTDPSPTAWTRGRR